MRMRRSGLAVVMMLVMAGCVPKVQLQPRSDAHSLAGDTSAAVAEAAGVRLIADGAAWKGHPGNLERRLTPVEIRLENQSGRTLRVRYEFFDLVGESRFRYAALSPLEMRKAQDAAPTCVAGYVPSYPWGLSWGWGPYWGMWHRAPWYPWGPGPFYGPYYGPPYVRCEEPLPTEDMVKRELPEGRLENGGTVAGFLYFQGVAHRERQVILQAQLVDATTGERFGVLTIPFQVSHG